MIIIKIQYNKLFIKAGRGGSETEPVQRTCRCENASCPHAVVEYRRRGELVENARRISSKNRG